MLSIREGLAIIPVEEGKDPSVFYNPIQEVNRDLSIAVIKAFKEEKNYVGFSIFEGLAATGLRSIRYAKEIPGVTSIIANDFDVKAVSSIEANVKFNGLEAIVKANRNDASLAMYLMKDSFDVVDLDPYGSASPFLDAAVQAVKSGGLLCVTCTDLAVLASANYPEVCLAKYGATIARSNHARHEIALRVVLQSIESAALRYKRTIEPLVSFSIDYYVRIFVKVWEKKSDSNSNENELNENELNENELNESELNESELNESESNVAVENESIQQQNESIQHQNESIQRQNEDKIMMNIDSNSNPNLANNSKINTIKKQSLNLKKSAIANRAFCHVCSGCGSFWSQPLGSVISIERKAKKRNGQRSASKSTSHLENIEPENSCKSNNQVIKVITKYQCAKSVPISDKCPICASTIHVCGPIWCPPIHNKKFVQRLLFQLEKLDQQKQQSMVNDESCSISSHCCYGTIDRMLGLCTMIRDELETFLCWDLPDLCNSLKVTTPPRKTIIAALHQLGYRTSNTHTNPTAFKTDAPVNVLWDVMRKWKTFKSSSSTTVKGCKRNLEISLQTDDPEIQIIDFASIMTTSASASTSAKFDHENDSDSSLAVVKRQKLLRFPVQRENWGPQAKPGNKTATGKVKVTLYPIN